MLISSQLRERSSSGSGSFAVAVRIAPKATTLSVLVPDTVQTPGSRSGTALTEPGAGNAFGFSE
ncbi:hypothetical protein SBA6_740026 [Candidatus Sulfopaludibacter sp. SbA6]|nr:hypothetical protein SBA6_740026 [Candidatus Sulfopaludibacter sp. SbA6]